MAKFLLAKSPEEDDMNLEQIDRDPIIAAKIIIVKSMPHFLYTLANKSSLVYGFILVCTETIYVTMTPL